MLIKILIQILILTHTFIHLPENQYRNRVRAQNIPVPQVRRPHHTLVRENAEALNVLLTRDMPVLSRAVQQTIERLDALIMRQLNDY